MDSKPDIFYSRSQGQTIAEVLFGSLKFINPNYLLMDFIDLFIVFITRPIGHLSKYVDTHIDFEYPSISFFM